MKNFLNNIEFPEFAKDNKLNISTLLMNNEKVVPDDLMAATIASVLYTNKEDKLLDLFLNEANLTEELIFAAKAAANIMKMNNIYYRGKHFLGNDYEDQQAKLRMGIYTKHGIDKKYFEFISLAVSFVNGCEFCVKSHSKLLEKEGMSKVQVHEALRIASIINTLRLNY